MFSKKWWRELTTRDEFWADFVDKVPAATLRKRLTVTIATGIEAQSQARAQGAGRREEAPAERTIPVAETETPESESAHYMGEKPNSADRRSVDTQCQKPREERGLGELNYRKTMVEESPTRKDSESFDDRDKRLLCRACPRHLDLGYQSCHVCGTVFEDTTCQEPAVMKAEDDADDDKSSVRHLLPALRNKYMFSQTRGADSHGQDGSRPPSRKRDRAIAIKDEDYSEGGSMANIPALGETKMKQESDAEGCFVKSESRSKRIKQEPDWELLPSGDGSLDHPILVLKE